MALANYTDLKAAVARAIKRSDMTDDIVDWIDMAEKELNKLLRRREMAKRATTATVSSQQAYELPSDFGDPVDLYLTDSDNVKAKLKPSDWTRVSTAFATSGRPREWAITANEIVLGPTPDAVYTLEMYYYRTVPALADSATNWLLTDNPRLYLFATLVQSIGAVSDEQQGAWAQAYADALANFKKDQIRERGFGGGPLLHFPLWGASNVSIFTDE